VLEGFNPTNNKQVMGGGYRPSPFANKLKKLQIHFYPFFPIHTAGGGSQKRMGGLYYIF
jgi:hypothetical protein